MLLLMSAPTGHAESCKCSVLPSVYLTDIVSYFPSDSVVTLHGCVTVLPTSLCVVFVQGLCPFFFLFGVLASGLSNSFQVVLIRSKV